jgi:hypothetical protein
MVKNKKHGKNKDLIRKDSDEGEENDLDNQISNTFQEKINLDETNSEEKDGYYVISGLLFETIDFSKGRSIFFNMSCIPSFRSFTFRICC